MSLLVLVRFGGEGWVPRSCKGDGGRSTQKLRTPRSGFDEVVIPKDGSIPVWNTGKGDPDFEPVSRPRRMETRRRNQTSDNGERLPCLTRTSEGSDRPEATQTDHHPDRRDLHLFPRRHRLSRHHTHSPLTRTFPPRPLRFLTRPLGPSRHIFDPPVFGFPSIYSTYPVSTPTEGVHNKGPDAQGPKNLSRLA